MSAILNSPERAIDLLTSRVTEGLTPEEDRELESLLHDGFDDEAMSLELTAAALHLSWLNARDCGVMPEHLERRVMSTGARWANERRRLLTVATRPSAFQMPRLVPWAIAACLALAFFLPRLAWRIDATSATTQSIASANDTITMRWKPWDAPEVPGVGGEIAWNERLQRGTMTFTGLPANDPARTQYQLWIIDERGMEQRINGAIFDSLASGTLTVEVAPSIRVRNAAAFAVTIEGPGGTWVSDMKRRVVIATRG